MKIVTYIFLAIVAIILIGYKIADYKFISYQEKEYQRAQFANITESPRTFPDSIKMPDKNFWYLINTSKAKYPFNYRLQLAYLTDTLSKCSNKDIIGFECTFRENMVRLWNYNIKSMYQIIEGNYISTDDFVYFRGYLISLGQEITNTAIQNPDLVSVPLDRTEWSGEDMIYVADQAYSTKNRQLKGSTAPRDSASAVDYDFGNYKMTGHYIPLDEFPRRFPKLTARY
ncbi:DUF4240 domain-containing protein [Hymenobacter sp. CRA2]|uniref:DUF4240 domain-containing protein n=1 Tax=Hymenobacter sp. CRA2 TaxID=1955620 RepID=UPI0009902876|nr:DUF4240 domain-containing protein [Hymenobacter sp. CRA2]OON65861.1 hypothetical protein B0919_22800 [Hymenobacter sp. CRA2]